MYDANESHIFMLNFISKIFGDPNERLLKKIRPSIDKINALEKEFESLKDERLPEKTAELKERLSNGETIDFLLPEAFALVREAAKRTLGQRHYDVQLIGGVILHQGKIAEMKTGEGKTLVATLPAYLNALSGKGVHIVTVNDYLSRRDAVWMGQIYHALGLSTGCLNHEASYLYDPKHENLDKKRDELGSFKVFHDFLRPCERKDAYAADITYGTNNEYGFDYLRDNMAYEINQISQRLSGHHFAVIDEVDSILIDEARTPLIISAPDAESPKYYADFAKIVPRLKEGADYNIDEKLRAVSITEDGINKVEQILGVQNIYEEKGFRYIHYLEQALKAQAIFKRDRDYVVKNGEIMIVDEFTGRLMPGRRYSEGLHQALEAKEGVAIQQESRTLASITFQNYFRMYGKIAGMTGTAMTSAEEFHKVYKFDVIPVPTNKPLIRKNDSDLIYKTDGEKWRAVVKEIKELNEKGRPVLVGTVSIEKNEKLASYLKREGVPFNLLNAKNHEQEAEIIAQAGKFKAVTVATNMAGRGVDIILGGNPPVADEADEVRKFGGLCVIGTERHEARRIDNQLRGRAGRQGDPGSSRFFISLEDDIMRIFGGDKIKRMMETFGLPEDTPIEHKIIAKGLEAAQAKIEGFNFDIRKHVLEYDEVLNKQRLHIYKTRRDVLEKENENKEKILKMFEEEIKTLVEFHAASDDSFNWNTEEICEAVKALAPLPDTCHQRLLDIKTGKNDPLECREKIGEYLKGEFVKIYEARENEIGSGAGRQIEKIVLLRTIDMLWMDHLDAMEHLRDSVRLRAYGQRDPLVEYKNEGYKMFRQLLAAINQKVAGAIFRVNIAPAEASNSRVQPASPRSEKSEIGRNDPCPCGKKNLTTNKPFKYKKCCYPKFG